MQYIIKNLKLVAVTVILTVLAVLTHFLPINTSAYHANRGQRTEAQAYSPEKCTVVCVLVSQGDLLRSTATLLHADAFRSSVPPGGLRYASTLIAVFTFCYVFYYRGFKRVRHLQQELALWLF